MDSVEIRREKPQEPEPEVRRGSLSPPKTGPLLIVKMVVHVRKVLHPEQTVIISGASNSVICQSWQEASVLLGHWAGRRGYLA